MTCDFGKSALVEAMRAGWGVEPVTVSRLPGHAHSINFRVETADGGVFAAKCIPAAKTAAVERLAAHAASAPSGCVATLFFGGRILDFGRWKVLAFRWIPGVRRCPDELTPAETDAFLAAYGELLAGLRDDGHILPLRDVRALKQCVRARLDENAAPEIVRELRLIDDASLDLPPEETRIIHGDLHHGNFSFADGKVAGFIDMEELRFGTPAEDIVRYVACRAERLRWSEPGRRARLLAAFRTFVRRLPYSRRAWLFAINGYLLRKLDKKAGNGRFSIFTRANLAFRFGFYHRLREIVCDERPVVRAHARTVVKIFGGRVRRFMGGPVFDWGDGYRFTCDPACQDYDWLCVYDEIPRDWPELEGGEIRLRCPAAHTMLITQEPVSVKYYNAAYARQFAVLLTNRPRAAENHPGYVKGAGYMVWYTGRSFAEERARALPEKTKGVSAVCSAKRMRHTEHHRRYSFMEQARAALEEFDWFGKGVAPIREKSDALDAYRYHVAFENHIGAGHWTEKIADALVAGCLPFYAGDPEIGRVLPADCFVPIPSEDPARALEIIRSAMAEDAWSRRRGAVEKARRLLFEKYNLFAQVAAAIENAPDAQPVPVAEGGLVPRRRTRLIPGAAWSDFCHHVRRLFTREKGASAP